MKISILMSTFIILIHAFSWSQTIPLSSFPDVTVQHSQRSRFIDNEVESGYPVVFRELSGNIPHFAAEIPCNILIYTNCDSFHGWFFRDSFDSIKTILESAGNTVTVEDRRGIPDLSIILPGDYSQFWFIDGNNFGDTTLSMAERDSIIAFAERGGGLAVISDHEPGYTMDANFISNTWEVDFNGWYDHTRTGTVECNTGAILYDHPINYGFSSIVTTPSSSRIQYRGTSAGFRPVSRYEGDTLQAVLIEGSLRIFFDCTLIRFLNGYLDDCSNAGEFISNLACWLEPSGCGCTSPISIESVWFFEETDCNDSNLITICYELTGDTADIYLQMSDDAGATWSVPLSTLFGASGDLGFDVAPGEHCFQWVMNDDFPGHEGCDFRVGVSTEPISYEYYLPMVINYTSCASGTGSRLYLQATYDSTYFEIDFENDGTVDTAGFLPEAGTVSFSTPQIRPGTYIITDNPVQIWYSYYCSNHGIYEDGSLDYSIFPVSMCGSNYCIFPAHSTSILAIEDSTVVRVDSDYSGSVDLSFILNSGEDTTLSLLTSPAHIFTGGGEKIAVVNHFHSADYYSATAAYMLLPVERLGDHYYAPPVHPYSLDADSLNSRVEVIAVQAGTNLLINGTLYTPEAGELITVVTESEISVISDRPVAAAYISDVLATDPWGSHELRHYMYAFPLLPEGGSSTRTALPGIGSASTHGFPQRQYALASFSDYNLVEIDALGDGIVDTSFYLDAGEIALFREDEYPPLSSGFTRLKSEFPLQVSYSLRGWWSGVSERTFGRLIMSSGVAERVIAEGCLDSRPPVVDLICPDDILRGGDTVYFEWSAEDEFLSEYPYELTLNYCGFEDTISWLDNGFSWVVPNLYCEEAWFQVSARDLFCNWGYAICFFEIRPVSVIPTIDSVWFWEETECNDSNWVYICYLLSGDTADINIGISADSGESWRGPGEEWFVSLEDTVGDYGLGIPPGVHCFRWLLSDDLPGQEGYRWLVQGGLEAYLDTFEIIDSFSLGLRSSYGLGLGYGEDRFWIYDPTEGYVYVSECPVYSVCEAEDSFFIGTGYNCDIDYADGYIYFCTNRSATLADDSLKRMDVYTRYIELLYVFSGAQDIEGVALTGDQLFASQCGRSVSTLWRLYALDLTILPATEIDTFISEPFGDCNTLEGLAYANGYLWGSNNNGRIAQIDLRDSAIVGCYPVPNVGMGAEGLCWNGEYLWYQNNATRNIYQINLTDFTASSFTASEALDSRSPEVELVCADTLTALDTVTFSWDVDELFGIDSPGSLFIDYCGYSETYFPEENSIDWVVPELACDSVFLRVAIRDSFCNWGDGRCYFHIVMPGTLWCILPDTVAFPGDSLLVPVHYSINQSLYTEGFFCSIYYHPEVAEIGELVIAGTVMEEWESPLLTPIGAGEVELSGAGQFYPGTSLLCYLKIRVLDSAPPGSYSGLDYGDIELIDSGIPRAGRNGSIMALFRPLEWMVDLVFDGTEEALNTTLTMGVSHFGSDAYDRGLDILGLPLPEATRAWFMLDDPLNPHITQLFRDIRNLEPVPICWEIKTSKSSGQVGWNPALLPPGDFILNGFLDMRLNDHFTYLENEIISVCYDRPRPRFFELSLSEGWNMVSFPVLPVWGALPDRIPSMIGEAYWYDPELRAYRAVALPERGKGYWIFSNADTLIDMAGIPVNSYQLPVSVGWNMIGSLHEPIAFTEISFDPPASFIPPQYGFESGGYIVSTIIVPGKAYWVISSGNSLIRASLAE
ncbi:IgGFc-binding protein [bacterium]|nr:IgGFc-binding protein [bacterium]